MKYQEGINTTKTEILFSNDRVMNMSDFEVDYDCVKHADKVVDFWKNTKHRTISTVALI